MLAAAPPAGCRGFPTSSALTVMQASPPPRRRKGPPDATCASTSVDALTLRVVVRARAALSVESHAPSTVPGLGERALREGTALKALGGTLFNRECVSSEYYRQKEEKREKKIHAGSREAVTAGVALALSPFGTWR